MRKIFYWLAITFGFLSCEKDEIPRAKPTATSADIVSVTIGSDYANQLFYNLKDRKVVLKNNREIWDLGFESSPSGFHLILNNSKVMAAFKTTETELAAVTSAQGVEWTWDQSSGNLDSTAIGDWRNNQFVYLIDRGTNTLGLPIGKMKMKIISVDDTKYVIQWAELESSTLNTTTILKDELGTFTYLSWNTAAQIVQVEPPKETWDICFTSYTHIFDGHMPYLVTGAISNRFGVKVHAVNDKAFAAISYVDYLSTNFNSHINNIGYNWKVYNFDTGIYAVDMTQNFIVKTAEGRVFKLHFLDYYDNFGVKGTPTMEIQEMLP